MNKTKYLKGECTACGGHIEFPAEAAGLTTECPHCGKTTELFLAAPPEEPSLPPRVIVWTLIAVLILGLGLAGALAALKLAQNRVARQKAEAAAQAAAASRATGQPAAVPEDPASKAGFQISDINLEKTPGTSVIHAVGTITNTQDRQRFGVRVEIDLFDAASRKLGTARDYQPVLDPKGQWQFKALVVDAKAATTKLAAIREDQ